MNAIKIAAIMTLSSLLSACIISPRDHDNYQTEPGYSHHHPAGNNDSGYSRPVANNRNTNIDTGFSRPAAGNKNSNLDSGYSRTPSKGNHTLRPGETAQGNAGNDAIFSR